MVALGMVSSDDIKQLANTLEEEEFRQGECIIHEGEVGYLFYILQSGEISVHRKDEGERDLEAEAMFSRRLAPFTIFSRTCFPIFPPRMINLTDILPPASGAVTNEGGNVPSEENIERANGGIGPTVAILR